MCPLLMNKSTDDIMYHYFSAAHNSLIVDRLSKLIFAVIVFLFSLKESLVRKIKVTCHLYISYDHGFELYEIVKGVKTGPFRYFCTLAWIPGNVGVFNGFYTKRRIGHRLTKCRVCGNDKGHILNGINGVKCLGNIENCRKAIFCLRDWQQTSNFPSKCL